VRPRDCGSSHGARKKRGRKGAAIEAGRDREKRRREKGWQSNGRYGQKGWEGVEGCADGLVLIVIVSLENVARNLMDDLEDADAIVSMDDGGVEDEDVPNLMTVKLQLSLQCQ